MRNVLAIAKKELLGYLTTMWGWAFFTFTALISSISFLAALFDFKKLQDEARLRGGWDKLPPEVQNFKNLTDGIVIPLWSVVLFLTLIFAAMLSARLFAEERKQKTMELLLTAPVRSIEIVLGKYFGGVGIVFLMLSVTLTYPAVLAIIGSSESGHALDWGTVFSGYLAMLLIGATAMAVGMFISSLTESVIVAALVSTIVMLLWMLSRSLVPAEEPARSFVNYFMLDSNIVNLIKGILDPRPIVFFTSVIAVFVMLTHRTVESERWS